MASTNKVIEVDHPLIADRLTKIRDKNTDLASFRKNMREISLLLGYEVTRNFATANCEISTPLETSQQNIIKNDIILVPILRAGLGMLDGIRDLLSEAKIGHIGMARNEETLTPESYYFNLPKTLPEDNVILIDPMLATGSSSMQAATLLKKEGANNITFLCLVSCPEGIANFQKVHPEITIYTASIDRCINEKGYILPGLGDAGDRFFGTL